MNRFAASCLALITLTAVTPTQSYQPLTRLLPKQALAQMPRGQMNEIARGQVLVKLQPSRAAGLQQAQARSLAATAPFSLPGAAYVSRIDETGWTLWSIPATTDPRAAVAHLKGQPGVVAAQPVNRIYPLWTNPNDPDFAVQERDPELVLVLDSEEDVSFRRLWHLTDTNAEVAWNQYQIKRGIPAPGWFTASNKPTNVPTIGIIDTGCDMTHPDFMNAGGTSTDSAYGGQLDHAKSAQFRLGRRVAGGSPQDNHGHGTHVTGLAVAAANNGGFNGQGTIGNGYNSKAAIYRVFDDSGYGTDADAAAAIYYAVRQGGVDIINLSLGTENFSQLFQDAVTFAWQKGVLVVAAGNEDGSGGGDLGPIYPAACSGALAVTANGPDGVPAQTYAGFGNYVDIAAPGGDVIITPEYYLIQFIYSTSTTYPTVLSSHPALYPPYKQNYTYFAGTSMASPMVAGAAGLYLNYHRITRWRGWTNVRTYQALQKSAASVMGAPYGGWEPMQGYGCLDMWSALMDHEVRGAVVGGVEGIVYLNSTPTPNVAVRAQRLTGGTTFSTTTNQHGYYRFEGMPTGAYKVWTAPFGQSKTKRVFINVGCDRSGFDFWCGTYTDDETPPYVAKFKATRLAGGALTLDQWGYDAETGIDKFLVKVGTSPGGAQAKYEAEYIPQNNFIKFGGITMTPGTKYYITATYVNGAGLSSTATTTITAS